MSFSELFAELAANDIELFLDGNAIRFRAPKGALTDSLRRQISANRASIIRRLQAPSSAMGSPTGELCRRCDMRDWVDRAPQDGRVRTHCGRCGRFIGYRPQNLAPGGRK